MILNDGRKFNLELDGKTYTSEANMNEIEITKAEILVHEMTREVEKYTKLLELAKEDRINVVKKYIRYDRMYPSVFDEAQKWLSLLEKGIDKRKKYEEKESFNLIQFNLRKMLDDERINVTKLSYYGYEGYGFIIDFKVNESDFSITIPNMEKINSKNFYLLNECKISLYEVNDWVHDCIVASYKEEEIKEEYKKFLGETEK